MKRPLKGTVGLLINLGGVALLLQHLAHAG